MENLIEYLDESLIPLEEKVKEYLHIERAIRLLEVELLSLQSIKPDFDPEKQDLEQTAAEGNTDNNFNDKEQKLVDMLEQYRKLQEEVIAMLPVQNKFVELNLGYGPSQVGYFTVDPDTHVTLDEPVLRVVH
jgi:chromosome segregation ATPase